MQPGRMRWMAHCALSDASDCVRGLRVALHFHGGLASPQPKTPVYCHTALAPRWHLSLVPIDLQEHSQVNETRPDALGMLTLQFGDRR